MQKNSKKCGFSFVGLSVTIIIISIVIAAIAYSISISRNAEAKAVITEMERYLSAIDIFRVKYKYRPGDLPEAEKFFEGAASVSGDGNDRWDKASERNSMWPQLNQAGLIRIDLTGTGDISIPGLNRPDSVLTYGGWTVLDSLSINIPGEQGKVVFHNILRFGGANNDEDMAKGVLPVSGHVYIDGKTDTPGTPFSGRYIVGEIFCAEETVAGSHIYKYTSDEKIKCTGNVAGAGDKSGSLD